MQATNLGRWPIEYPKHRSPKHRYDILLTYVLIAACVLVLVLPWVSGKHGASNNSLQPTALMDHG